MTEIEDYSSRKLKRFYFRSLRGAWKHARWCRGHSTLSAAYSYHSQEMKAYQEDADAAKAELQHRKFYV